MSKAKRLRRLETKLSPLAAARLPKIVITTVATHAEHVELQALRSAHRGPLKLPEGSGPVVQLTAAEYRQLFTKQNRKDSENAAQRKHPARRDRSKVRRNAG